MLRTSLIAALLTLAGCSSVKPAWSIATASDDTRRTTTSGEVIGGAGRYGSHAWLGIPFAAPPIGALRWRAPQPPAPWTTPLAATKFGRACVQPATLFVTDETPDNEVIGSEDCLTLNVWAPPFEAGKIPTGDERLPVMVWIHGGANSLGSSASYDLGHLATGQRVLGVSVQYRLGPLGWFRNPALREGNADPLDASGNYGTLDLIRALEWVRDNAAAFGGNPDNVTIFGESAGGQNVYSLLLSPRAKGLFHRAIAQSPVLARGTLAASENFSDDPSAPGHKNSSSETMVRMLMQDGTPDRAAAKQQLQTMGLAKQAEYLRAKPAAEIIRTYLAGNGDRSLRMLDMPLVIPDGEVEPKDTWIEAFARADGWNQVPVMTGTNLEEAKLFLFLDPRFTWKLFGKLPRMRDEQKYEVSSQVMSRLWKAWSVDAVAEAMHQSGAPAIYAYRFDFADLPTKLGTDLKKMLGAAHGMEISFAHGHFDGQLAQFMGDEGRAEREALSNAMMGYWAEFARTGKPGKGGANSTSPEWLPYDVTPDAPKFMTLDAAPPGLRMGNTVERAGAVIADMIADKRMPDLAEKCEGLQNLERTGFVTAAQLAEHCAQQTAAASP